MGSGLDTPLPVKSPPIVNLRPSHQYVQFSDQQLSEADASLLGSYSEVRIKECNLSPQFFRALISHKPILRLVINASGIDEEACRMICTMNQLQSLLLGSVLCNGTWNTIQDQGAVYVAKLEKLRQLDLARNDISSNGLRHFRKLTRLESLKLNYNRIDDQGAYYLSFIMTLKQLNLDTNKIGNQGTPYLAKLPNLKILSIVINCLTISGFLEFRVLKNLIKIITYGNELSSQQSRRLKQRLQLSLPKIQIV